MKTNKLKIRTEDDARWIEYNELKSKGLIIEAKKLKEAILNSYKYKKPCHHVKGEVN